MLEVIYEFSHIEKKYNNNIFKIIWYDLITTGVIRKFWRSPILCNIGGDWGLSAKSGFIIFIFTFMMLGYWFKNKRGVQIVELIALGVVFWDPYNFRFRTWSKDRTSLTRMPIYPVKIIVWQFLKGTSIRWLSILYVIFFT